MEHGAQAVEGMTENTAGEPLMQANPISEPALVSEPMADPNEAATAPVTDEPTAAPAKPVRRKPAERRARVGRPAVVRAEPEPAPVTGVQAAEPAVAVQEELPLAPVDMADPVVEPMAPLPGLPNIPSHHQHQQMAEPLPVLAPARSPVLSLVVPESVALMARAMEQARQPLPCTLCTEDGGELVVRLQDCRVIRAQEAGFPAFYRVVWNTHVAEWSDLSDADQLVAMRVLNTVERTLRELLHPTKINLASLGNVVPHLHWHVVARFDWDSHFPAPIWGAPQRKVEPAHNALLEQLMPQVDAVLRQRLMPW